MGLAELIAPAQFGRTPIERVHEQAYIDFLESCWHEWTAAGFKGEAIANIWPSREMRTDRVPDHIEGKLGYYALAAETSIGAGTWEAARASVDVALTGQQLIASGEASAFALCRPPGHHATKDTFGGYCYFNNAAISAQASLDQGGSRIAILDIDFHHGNGTQSIFYDRSDVIYLSIHGRPEDAFPYYLGYSDETGSGAGQGFNFNYPMKAGTGTEDWLDALSIAIKNIARLGADMLVVSLGVDAFELDPISTFRLKSTDFLRCGEEISSIGLPTLFAMEGGYAIEAIGTNTVNVLQGFLAE